MVQKILYLVSEDWYFVSHRLPMARAAQNAGYEVHVAARIGDCAAQITQEGFVLHPIHWRRGSLNPIRVLAAIWKPDAFIGRFVPTSFTTLLSYRR